MRWPAGMEPDQVPVFVHNEIVIEAAPQAVWAWLVRVGLWPEWYPNCPWVKLLPGALPELSPGYRWKWKTFGVAIESVVQVFEPHREIGWEAKGLGNNCYHGWTLEPVDGNPQRTKVITEETQNGIANSLLRLYLRRVMPKGHDLWLRSLKQRVEAGPPPAL